MDKCEVARKIVKEMCNPKVVIDHENLVGSLVIAADSIEAYLNTGRVPDYLESKLNSFVEKIYSMVKKVCDVYGIPYDVRWETYNMYEGLPVSLATMSGQLLMTKETISDYLIFGKPKEELVGPLKKMIEDLYDLTAYLEEYEFAREVI